MQSSSYQLNKFIEYVRAIQFCQNALKVEAKDSFVFVSRDDIQRRFLNNPTEDIEKLKEQGELEVKEITTRVGYKCYLYKTLKPGYYDLTLLKPRGRELDETTYKMMMILRDVSLNTESESTEYFDALLKHKNVLTRLFFNVDCFSGRVHTPITSLKSEYRKNILIDDMETVSIDVVTMQPVLLGKILENEIGSNNFTTWINEGKDIYSMLQEIEGVASRDIGKKRFFEILFAPANSKLSNVFGNANWINWINSYKTKQVPENPHTLEKNYSNLAWLLQNTEVQMMKKVWAELQVHGIKFLSVHDEIIVKKEDYFVAKEIFSAVLGSHLSYFRLSDKGMPTPEPIKIEAKQPPNPQEANKIQEIKPIPILDETESVQIETPVNWDSEIRDIEIYLSSIDLPNHPIRLDKNSIIVNLPLFIHNHLAYVKANNGNPAFLPYLNRLKQLKGII